MRAALDQQRVFPNRPQARAHASSLQRRIKSTRAHIKIVAIRALDEFFRARAAHTY